MEKPSLLSPKERKILLIYFLSAVGVIALYLLFGVFRTGLPVQSPVTNKAEIALLAPLSNTQQELGKAVLNVAGQAVLNRPPEKNPGDLEITVVGYDTHGTADGAARAAIRAARKPETVAIIGPLDARQALAAAEAIQGKDLAILTSASSAPVLPVQSIRGLYRLPATDDLQGRAMAEFLVQNHLHSNIFLIGESESFSNGSVDAFKSMDVQHLAVVDEISLTDSGEIPTDLIERAKASQAEIIVFLGGDEQAGNVEQALQDAGITTPFLHNVDGFEAANQVLQHPAHRGYYLVVEPFAYVQTVLNAFVNASGNQLVPVGSAKLEGGSIPADLGQKIKESQASTVIYLGRPDNALAVVMAMNTAGLKIPLLSSDGINDPKLLQASVAGMPIYYTSPLLSLPALPGDQTLTTYFQALGELSKAPFAYETTQATWLILDALTRRYYEQVPRQAVWEQLSQTSVDGMMGQVSRLAGGHRLPQQIWVYQIPSQATDWSQNPLVWLFQE